ncbi:MAG: hypothetical protein IID33_00725 [Planctomycetes bacterium]|nr:hypothetical protein [Planctomycetota bacterium]
MRMVRIGHPSRPAMAMVLSAVLVVMPPPRAVARQAADGWSPALAVLRDSYRQANYAAVQRECNRLLQSPLDEQLRRDVQALFAMTLLRMPQRDDRIAGRDMLLRLDRQGHPIGRRPECLLALGVGLMGLNETGAALDNLARAVDAFEAAGDRERTAEAYGELASAWARHTEWELTPARFGIGLPAGSNEITAVRLDQVEALLARAAKLSDGGKAAARVDLVLARVLLEPGADAARGAAILERLASSAVVDDTAARAILRLAAIRSDEKRWTDAVELYKRLATAELGAMSTDAVRWIEEITSPRLELELPGGAAPGERITAAIRARNLASLALEVRRIDIVKWLEDHQGRLIEAQLPDDGAVVLPTRSIIAKAPIRHAWWQSAEALQLEAGAYVIRVSDRDTDGPNRAIQKLLLVGDLNASMFVGNGRAAVWALTADGKPLTGEINARFWMQATTFVARPHPLTRGVATFALPPESRQPGRRWVCLVSRGDDLAICRGQLSPRNVEPQSGLAVALLTNGLSFDVGDTLHLKGLLLLPRGTHGDSVAGKTVRLDVLDSGENLLTSHRSTVNEFGTFEIRIPITRNRAGQSSHIITRLDDRVIPNANRQTVFQVALIEQSDARLTVALPLTIDTEAGTISGTVSAALPGGASVGDATIQLSITGMQLPDREQHSGARVLERQLVAMQLNADGRRDFSVPLGALGFDGRFAAIQAGISLSDWDNLPVVGSALAMVAPQPVQIWLASEPKSPQAGRTAVIRIDTYDFADLSAGQPPILEVFLQGSSVARPEVRMNLNQAAEAEWRPEQIGEYVVVATVRLRDGGLAAARMVVTVVDQAVPLAAPGRLTSQFRFVRDGAQSMVEVELTGGGARTVLAILDDGAPLAAQAAVGGPSARRATLPFDQMRTHAAQVLLASPTPNGIELVAAGDLAGNVNGLSALTIRPDRSDVPAGASVSVEFSLTDEHQRPLNADLTLRLIDFRRRGVDPIWEAFSGEAEQSAIATGLSVVSSRQTGGAPARSVGVRHLSRSFNDALFGGQCLRISSASLREGRVRVDVALPSEPGLYELIAVARTADGALHSNSVLLSNERGLRARLDSPPRLSIGDRTVLIVTVTNDRTRQRTARVELALGSKLTAIDPTAVDLTMAPGESRSLEFRVEASQTGRSTMTVTVDSSPGQVLTLSAACQIESDMGAVAGVATGRFDRSQPVRLVPGPESQWISHTKLRLQRSLSDVIVDAAEAWINDPIESTAWQAVRLSWAEALRQARPNHADLRMADILSPADVDHTGTARVRQISGLTLSEFIADAVERLLATRHADGGWGYWESDLPAVPTTVAALAALRHLAANDPELARRVRRSELWLKTRLSSMTESQDWRRADDRPALCSVLRALAPNAAADVAFGRSWSQAADQLLRIHEQLTVGVRCDLAAALIRVGRTSEAERVMNAVSPNTGRERMRLDIAALEGSDIAAATAALDRLLSARSGAAWDDPLLTAQILRGLARQLPRLDDVVASGTVRITADDKKITAIALDDLTAERTVSLDAAGSLVLHHTGSGRLSAVWTGLARQRTDPAGETHVTRELIMLTRELASDGERFWRRSPITGDVAIRTEQRLMVREFWEFAGRSGPTDWVQHLPAGFIPWRKTNTKAATIGDLHDRTVDTITWTTPAVGAAMRLREYILVPVRPGTYLFPAPTYRVDGRGAPLRVIPPRQRLTVTR